MKFEYGADMGSIKIFSDDFSAFYDNNYGDGYFQVKISIKKIKEPKNYQFKGHFTVKEKNKVFLAQYDCDNHILYTFKKLGRYFVYANKGDMYIIYCDDALEA